MPDKKELVEVICPKCRHTEIIYLQREDIPKCSECDTRMVMREFLREGKSY
jgi:ribosomal protein S27E